MMDSSGSAHTAFVCKNSFRECPIGMEDTLDKAKAEVDTLDLSTYHILPTLPANGCTPPPSRSPLCRGSELLHM